MLDRMNAVRSDADPAERAVQNLRGVGLGYIHLGFRDMIFRGENPYVLEVNASPGFHGLLDATGVNAAGPIVDYAVEKAKAGR